MPPEELASYLDQRPFVPFRIHLTDGTRFEIRHPEMVLLGRRSAVIGMSNNGASGRPLYDRTATVALLHITRIERIEAGQTQE